MKSWSQRELALAVLVVFAAPAIPYVTSRLLGDLSSLFLGTVPLIGTLLSLFLYACISALVTGGRFFSGRFGVELPPLMDRDIGRPMES